MSALLSDVRLALRGWRRAPVFTLIAIGSMALGIGANTAIFTLVDQVLLRTLPIQRPHELVQLTPRGAGYGSNWGDGSELSYPMLKDILADQSSTAQPSALAAPSASALAMPRDHNQVFSGIFGRFSYDFHTGYAGRTERVAGELVSGSYFQTLGVPAAAGRVFTQDDDRVQNGHPVAVLSHAYWSSRFAADPSVVGKTLVINAHPYTIVGVAREGFEGVELGNATQVYVPMMMKSQVTPGWDGLDDPRYRWVRVFARLKPGVTAEQARAALQPLYTARLQQEVKERAFANASQAVRDRFVKGEVRVDSAARGRSGLRRALTRPLWVLMAIAAGVLLIACANVANLLLARGAGRQREMAVRLALGASRGRLVKQLLAESVLLASAGGLLGLVVAWMGATMLLGYFGDPESPQAVSTTPDLRILAFTFAVSMLTGILFGLAPALQSTRPRVAPTLKDQAGSVLGGGQARLRKALVASQVAVSLLLLIGAGLFIRTLHNLTTVDLGLKTDNLISFAIDPSLNGYTPARSSQLAKELLERLRATPGVTSAGFAAVRILEDNQWTASMTIEGYTPKADERMGVWCNSISPGYFEALGIPLLMGREFDQRDEGARPRAPKGERDLGGYRVAIVTERFAKQYFGNANPIGRHIGFGSDPGTPTPIEIVGVVRDSKYTGVRDETPRQAFFPYLQQREPGGFTAYVRTNHGADSAFAQIRDVLRQLDPNLPISGARTLETQVALSLRNDRLVAMLSTIFGSLATLLAVIGLYGVMAYTVSRRTREIGIRMALGARMGSIGWLIIREVLTIVILGMALGLPAAWWLGRYVSAQLYGVQATDAVTVIAATLLLAAVALLAGLIPSARAARVSPTTALRYE